MNTPPDLDRVFPLSGGSALRPALRPPRLSTLVKATPGVMMGNRALLRAWAARRARALVGPANRTHAVGPGSSSQPSSSFHPIHL